MKSLFLDLDAWFDMLRFLGRITTWVASGIHQFCTGRTKAKNLHRLESTRLTRVVDRGNQLKVESSTKKGFNPIEQKGERGGIFRVRVTVVCYESH